MDEQDNKIDPFSPAVVMAFIVAFLGDISFFLILTHWIAGFIVLAVLWHRMKGFLPKFILVLCAIIPLPILTIGILFGSLISNKAIAFLAEQVAIQLVAVATGGAGEALEGAALAEEGGAAAVEGIEASAAAAETATAAESAATAAAEAAEASETASGAAGGTEEGVAENDAEKSKRGESTVRDKIKEKFKEKLQEKLSAGEDEDQAREEIQDEEQEEEASDERYDELVTPDSEKDPIALEVERMKKVVPINRPQPTPKENPSTKKLDERLARQQAKLQKAREVEKQLGKSQASEDRNEGRYPEGGLKAYDIMKRMQGKRTAKKNRLRGNARGHSFARRAFDFCLRSRRSDIQAGDLPITWRALNSYAPPGYTGKVFPNRQWQVEASLQVITNGKLTDISAQTIYWYQNDNLLGGGVGVRHTPFRPYGEAPGTMTLKIELPDYPSGVLIHQINIPIVGPSRLDVTVSAVTFGRPGDSAAIHIFSLQLQRLR